MSCYFFLDASALAKRYVDEIGSTLVNYLFANVPLPGLLCQILTTAEVASILLRKKNRGDITVGAFRQAELEFRKEVLDEPAFPKLPAADALILAAIRYIDVHSINSSDAIVLGSAIAFRIQLSMGDTLVLVAADQRLLRAAQAEGLLTFNPEIQTQVELDVLIAP